jgi:hypothetical protein
MVLMSKQHERKFNVGIKDKALYQKKDILGDQSSFFVALPCVPLCVLRHAQMHTHTHTHTHRHGTQHIITG